MALNNRRRAIVEPVPTERLVGLRQIFDQRRPSVPRARRRVERVRMAVLGGARVGKTSLIYRFLGGSFVDGLAQTVEDLYHGQRHAHGVIWILELLDTAGSHSFPAMRRLAIDTATAFMLVYSVDSEESFEEVRRIREEILARRGAVTVPDGCGGGLVGVGARRAVVTTAGARDTTGGASRGRCVPIVVVGNKCDVTEDQRFLPAVTTDMLVNVEWGHYYVETSAVENINVEKAFTDVLYDHSVSEQSQPSPGWEPEPPRMLCCLRA